MPPIDYVLLRFIRRRMPKSLFRFFLRRHIFVKPGIETREPETARDDYLRALAQAGQTLDGKRILLFGYGGNFTLGCLLLEAGAAHVILVDKYAPPNDRLNAELLPKYTRYLEQRDGHVLLRPERLTLLQEDIADIAASQPACADLVFSRSVYEHLEDVEGITRSLVAVTQASGWHVHIIDLSDHYFKYPFEMLTYSADTWRKWLNPTSNLNRFRCRDYEQIFQQNFGHVEIKVLDRRLEEFEKARAHIRPEFLTGDPQADSITKIQVIAAQPGSGARIDKAA